MSNTALVRIRPKLQLEGNVSAQTLNQVDLVVPNIRSLKSVYELTVEQMGAFFAIRSTLCSIDKTQI